MKLKKLNIDSYRHLQNIKFNFIYPEGHIKAGKPLDKICFIGQSATGKTSVLEIIKRNVSLLESVEVLNGNVLMPGFDLGFEGQAAYLYKGGYLGIDNDSILLGEKKITRVNEMIGGGTLQKGLDEVKLLYLTTDIVSKENIDIFNQNPIDILSKVSNDKKIQTLNKKSKTSYLYEFIQNIKSDVWYSLLFDILDYRKRFTQMASEAINKGAIADINRLASEFNRWSSKNKNPLLPFSDFFNPILHKLNLEVDIINTEYSIPIKSKLNDSIIKISDLSTGTKGLLLSMFPLYELDTSDAIILLDEPERSLFPDLQIELISYYQKLAPTAQFIVATHSPFIAAAFEPEERFVLYFDEKGKVKVRQGESPIGDDPNDILRDDFNIDYYNEFGKQAYQKYLGLKAQVAEEQDKDKKKDLVREMAMLGDKYNF